MKFIIEVRYWIRNNPGISPSVNYKMIILSFQKIDDIDTDSLYALSKKEIVRLNPGWNGFIIEDKNDYQFPLIEIDSVTQIHSPRN